MTKLKIGELYKFRSGVRIVLSEPQIAPNGIEQVLTASPNYRYIKDEFGKVIEGYIVVNDQFKPDGYGEYLSNVSSATRHMKRTGNLHKSPWPREPDLMFMEVKSSKIED